MVAVHENAEDPLTTSADASGHVCPRVLGAQNRLTRPVAMQKGTASIAALTGERAAALCVRAQPNVVVCRLRAHSHPGRSTTVGASPDGGQG